MDRRLKSLFYLAVFLLITDMAILFNIAILRQILGFFFLLFIPGALILCLLKLEKIKFTEKVIITVGLSITFLMIAGLIYDQVLYAIGNAKPLSTFPLLLFLNIFVIGTSIISYLTNLEVFPFHLSEFKLNTQQIFIILFPSIFPILSILGVHMMNVTNNNIILMILLCAIPIFILWIAIQRRKVSEYLYPLIIFLISISILLMISLRSDHLIGMDVHEEYNLFKLIFAQGHWSLITKDVLNSCLSVTILPTIFNSLVHMDPESLFRILLIIIFSFCPVVVYLIARKCLSSFYAFLASFFFIAQAQFIAFPGRTQIAILFSALTTLLLFNGYLIKHRRNLLIVIFSIATVASHYTTSYIYFFIIFITWVSLQIYQRFINTENKMVKSIVNPESGVRETIKNNITIGFVLLFSYIVYVWYRQLTQAPFNASIFVARKVIISFQTFFSVESRGIGGEASAALGLGIFQKNFAQQFEFVISWLTIILVTIGILVMLLNLRKKVHLYSGKNEENNIIHEFTSEFIVFSITCFGILALALILPYVSDYGMGRAYMQMSIVLSISFIFGGITLAKLTKVKSTVIILIFLIPYCLCSFGITYQVFGFPKSIFLNSQGSEYNEYYIHEEEGNAAIWLKDFSISGAVGNTIYTDIAGYTRLVNQAGINWYSNDIELLAPNIKTSGYIYLRYFNVVNGKVLENNGTEKDIAEYKNVFEGRNKIYANGGSEIWK